MGNPARKTYRAKRDSRRAQTFKLSLPGIVEVSTMSRNEVISQSL